MKLLSSVLISLIIGFIIGSEYGRKIPSESNVLIKEFKNQGNEELGNEYLQKGMKARDGEKEYMLESWYEAFFLVEKTNKKRYPKEQGKFIVAEVTFSNDGYESAFVEYDLASVLFDDKGRKFDKVNWLCRIVGNTACNESIQPGFRVKELIAFEIPKNSQPDYVMFWDPDEENDKIGEKSAIRFRLH